MMPPVYTNLPNRAQITVAGHDAEHFLQGLITNDIAHLNHQPLLYACLLTAQGKFLYDFFIRKHAQGYILDCEGEERAASLLKKLKIYKLRSNVDLELKDQTPVYQIFNGKPPTQVDALPDPRHKECGYRCYEEPKNMPRVAFDVWDKHRIQYEVPDGSRDLIPEKSFLHLSLIHI